MTGRSYVRTTGIFAAFAFCSASCTAWNTWRYYTKTCKELTPEVRRGFPSTDGLWVDNECFADERVAFVRDLIGRMRATDSSWEQAALIEMILALVDGKKSYLGATLKEDEVRDEIVAALGEVLLDNGPIHEVVIRLVVRGLAEPPSATGPRYRMSFDILSEAYRVADTSPRLLAPSLSHLPMSRDGRRVKGVILARLTRSPDTWASQRYSWSFFLRVEERDDASLRLLAFPTVKAILAQQKSIILDIPSHVVSTRAEGRKFIRGWVASVESVIAGRAEGWADCRLAAEIVAALPEIAGAFCWSRDTSGLLERVLAAAPSGPPSCWEPVEAAARLAQEAMGKLEVSDGPNCGGSK
jgi:hypothetical protein